MSETALPPVIQAMLQPQFYPHAVSEPIQLFQTHVSYVLLTGEFVYKLKKPVNFGFLDFSTLEKRQHFCQEELRLNARGAAKLYLEVVPIAQAGDDFTLGTAGDVVEYAVKMQQFPQETLLSEMFDRSLLTEGLVIDLAKELALFHSKSQTDDYIRSFGTVEKIRQAFDENYDQSVGYIDRAQTQAQWDATKAYTDRFFAENGSIFQSRIAADKIRECHGDIHLRNIAYWNNEMLLFDCIEFNEPFRFVDTMYDLAFVCMDLDARGRKDFSNLLMNTYLEQTGDWEGAQLLPLYLSRQAYVRAKVTSFLLDDPTIPEKVKQASAKTAADYYKLAYDYTQAQTGRIVLMAGLSGSGKSTTANQLARHQNAIHLRSDAVRKHLAGIPVDQRGSDEIYSAEMTEKTYDRLRDLGILLASQGFTVILDAKYDRQALREPVIAQSTGIPVTILHCDAPMEVLQQRVRDRVGDIADATVAVLAEQVFEPFSAAEQGSVKTIDTTQAIAEQLAQAGF
ncbi:MAG: AAA family ATPase [Synechococcales bacterium]|nr:AAA family ATPase [Synechococcales bacterium]